ADERDRQGRHQCVHRVERRLPERLQHDAAAAVRRRKLWLQPSGNRRELRLRLLPADARLHANETLNPVRAAVVELVPTWIADRPHRRWHPELELISDERAVKPFGRDADDGVQHAVQTDRAPESSRIIGELALPELMADDDDGMRVPPDVLAWL